ncbi:MAG TPA: DNA mismatch repair endonuclease MutL [Bryobacteraceae bacterium]|nr:DNA mismatch repair endonuclease MutL [Bryobacteraceae bacterium]HPT27512.1 DNA mismatch repair endonuclease MutL [Bryobacteraceae bacterium]
MGKIRVLSDIVANKIAAGEVVERPASVVKELLENSLDAGATELRIDVESGGRRLIRVADNGCGLMRDDAMLAFERHATSKLSDVKQLDAIATLGFRGEALPSIASVSRLVVETIADGESVGTRVEIAGGKMINCTDHAVASGTAITVRDLFFNVPARKKFLRTEQTELAHIASLVTHYSLAHPQKTFSLYHGAKELLRVTPVETLRERVFQVFGGAALEDLIELDPGYAELAAEDGYRGFHVSGFISRPQVQKSNRNSIFLFVNRRLIRDRLLMHSISSAYHNLMPPACYPFALLFLDCDPAEVDVNVHPSKTEVRFRHSSFVHDFVRDTMRESLMRTRPMALAPPPLSPAQPAAYLPYSEFSQSFETHRFDEPRSVLPDPLELKLAPPPPAPAQRFDFQPAPRLQEAAPTELLRLKVPDTHMGFPASLDLDPPQSMAALGTLRVLGQLHYSFIIATGTDGLWIIDQHVAHERILFEQVLQAQSRGNVEVQRLLLPAVIQLTAAQQIEYDRIAGELEASGFETEPFGNRTIAVKAAPAGLPQDELERVVLEVIEMAESEFRRVSVSDLRRGIAASIACRAAIKINTPLDAAKMDYLLVELERTQYPMACPHGRPVALRYTMREILRSFHRI